MPSVSKSQQRLMGAAEHGATFPAAEKLRKNMTHDQLHDFAAGPMTGKPDHVNLLKGSSPDIMKTNMKTMKRSGKSEFQATQVAIGTATKHPSRHKNLGTYLHKPKK